MKLFIAVLSALLGAAVAIPSNSRIIGGIEVDENEYPFICSLRTTRGDPDSHFCAATVVNNRWVMTSGVCCFGMDQIDVLAGVSHLHDHNGQEVMSSQVVIHPEFDIMNNFNDICMIQLAQPLVFGETLMPVQLPMAGEETDAGTMTTVMGWGITHLRKPHTEKLHEVNVTVVDDADCQAAYSSYEFTESFLCAGMPEGGADACDGDSGGPYVLTDEPDVQVGIVSWGQGCGLPGIPGVATQVSYYVDWIASLAKQV